MGESTGISWCDATFNPWIGCENVSPGCGHCYARSFTKNRMGLDVWMDQPRRVAAESTWRNPAKWARLARDGRLPNGKENPDGHRPRIFCASLADVFEDRPELEAPRLRLFEAIGETPELDWLILTKRPDVMRDWFQRMPLLAALPLPNVWVGTSIENSRYTWRADVLREIPAVLRFVSCEPLLGSLYPERRDIRDRVHPDAQGGEGEPGPPAQVVGRRAPLDLAGIDWVIVGGESGPRKDARPMHPEWVREIRDAVQAVSIEDEPFDITRLRPAFHFKQWGSYTPDPWGRAPEGVWVAPDGRVASWFAVDALGLDFDGAARMRYAGAAPTSGGKFLDGTDWCEMPDPVATPA